MTPKKATMIKKMVDNLEPGSVINIVLMNSNKKECLVGKYITNTSTYILIEAESFTVNKKNQKKIIGVPFGSMKYVEFKCLEEILKDE